MPTSPPPNLWYSLVDEEEGELLSHTIVEEIIQRSQDILFEKHISSQVLPYAVTFSKDVLVKMMEWEFFKKDTEDPSATIWQPDKEPLPIPIDSWAPSAIPIKKVENREPLNESKYGQENGELECSTNRGMGILERSQSSSKFHRRTMSTKLSSLASLSVSDMLSSQDKLLRAQIEEDNKKALQHIAEIERNGGKQEYTVDKDGRIFFIKIPCKRKLTPSTPGSKSPIPPSTPLSNSRSLRTLASIARNSEASTRLSHRRQGSGNTKKAVENGETAAQPRSERRHGNTTVSASKSPTFTKKDRDKNNKSAKYRLESSTHKSLNQISQSPKLKEIKESLLPPIKGLPRLSNSNVKKSNDLLNASTKVTSHTKLGSVRVAHVRNVSSSESKGLPGTRNKWESIEEGVNDLEELEQSEMVEKLGKEIVATVLV